MITLLDLQSFFNDEAEVDPEELWENLTDEEIATGAILRREDGEPDLLQCQEGDRIRFFDRNGQRFSRCSQCGEIRKLTTDDDWVKPYAIAEIQQDFNGKSVEWCCQECADNSLVETGHSGKYLYTQCPYTIGVLTENGRYEFVDTRSSEIHLDKIVKSWTMKDGQLCPTGEYVDISLCTLVESVHKGCVYVLSSEVGDDYAICRSCGRLAPKSEILIDGDCEACVAGIYVDEYHEWDGPMLFKKTDAEQDVKEYFGIEIETEGDFSNIELVTRYQDIWHLEEDGSLGEGGFEMISQPMSWNYIKLQEPRFKALFKSLANAGQKSHNGSSCGLHVHVSREAFKDEDAINRCLLIVHAFRRNMMEFGRRFDSEWARFTEIPLMPGESDLNRIGSTGHNVAVNCGYHSDDDNTDTIEFRFPKGSLNILTVMATIEFIKNIVELSNSDADKIQFKNLIYGEFVPDYIRVREERWHRYFDKGIELNLLKLKLDKILNRFCSDSEDERSLECLVQAISAVSGRTIMIEGDTE